MTELVTYTSFLDILGFSFKINKNICSDKKALEFKNNINEIIDFLNKKDSIFKDELNLKYTLVSDTIVLQLKVFKKNDIDDNLQKAEALYMLLLAIGILQQYFVLKFNIFLRGGITAKYTYIDENFLLGQGISIAHKLENEIAKVPRIIFEEGLLNNSVINHLLTAEDCCKQMTKIILQDKDQYYYLNYLNTVKAVPIQKVINNELNEQEAVNLFYEKHKKLIEKEMESSDINITMKYLWLKEYHNNFIKNNNLDIELKIKC